jgi:L-2-hydroxyglutarate oxidase
MTVECKMDITIVGGGIIGLATAMECGKRFPGSARLVLEKELNLASHQTGRNSGVIHSGLYYKPGSAKAKNAVAGAREMVEFCREHRIPCEVCGKVVVATEESEIPALEELYRRGWANGIPDLDRIGPEGLGEIEPHATGLKALVVGSTGIVDYSAVAAKYAEIVRKQGGEIRRQTEYLSLRRDGDLILETTRGPVRTRYLVNCGGLHSDRIARSTGVDPGLRIVPFRGEYYELVPEKRNLVRSLIYPVPDPRFPFLGVHFTRMIKGGVEAGPNAVLSLKREGYSKFAFSFRDAFETLTYGSFWKMGMKYWRTGLGELHRSFSKQAFVKALQRLLPEIRGEDLKPGNVGVRAQALEPGGALVDDFRIIEQDRIIHVLNAPSPAATASLPISRHITDILEKAWKE